MLDKIIIVNKHKAYFIFHTRLPFEINSTEDVTAMLLWFLGHPQAQLIMKEESVVGIKIIKYTDDITMKIDVKDVA